MQYNVALEYWVRSFNPGVLTTDVLAPTEMLICPVPVASKSMLWPAVSPREVVTARVPGVTPLVTNNILPKSLEAKL
jgi:hypothetical protein